MILRCERRLERTSRNDRRRELSDFTSRTRRRLPSQLSSRARVSPRRSSRVAMRAAAPGALAPGATPSLRARARPRRPSVPRPAPAPAPAPPRSSGDGVEGVPAEDRVVVRFWHLWGGGADGCRAYVVGAERGSVYRDPARMESRVRALARVFDERTGLDVPACLTRAPPLMTMDAADVCRAMMALKRVAPEIDGVGVSRAPALLLRAEDQLRAARRAMVSEAGEAEVRAVLAARPEELLRRVDALVGADARTTKTRAGGEGDASPSRGGVVA